jgi:hypothetical protein
MAVIPITCLHSKFSTTFFSTAVAQIIQKLKTTLDATGQPLLDSTLILWTSEFGGTPSPHTNARVPIMLFGNGAGQFKTGRMFQA